MGLITNVARDTTEQIIEAIREAGLAHLTDLLIPFIRPSIRMHYADPQPEEIPIGASRIGGLPDLPPEMEWPIYRGAISKRRREYVCVDPGGPLCHIAQINLADVAPFDSQGLLPSSGMLYFFAAVWMNCIGIAGWENEEEEWAVLYYDGDPARLSPRLLPPIPEELLADKYYQRSGVASKGHIFCPVALRFRCEMMLSSNDNPKLSRLLFPDGMDTNGMWDAWQRLEEIQWQWEPNCSALHRMLGYPELIKHYFEDEHFDMVSLLQLDSEDNRYGPNAAPCDLYWENEGRGHFLIHPEDLAVRDFSRVILRWDTT